MRLTPSILVVIGLLSPLASAQEPPGPSPPLPGVDIPARTGQDVVAGRADLADVLPHIGEFPDVPAVDPEFPEGTRVLPLTLKRTYALAMIRDLRPAAFEGDRSALTDPARLDALAREVGADDFARFRAWFLDRGASRPIEDPAAARDAGAQFLDVLALSREAETAQRVASLSEKNLSLCSKYAMGGAGSGISQLQVDEFDCKLQEARFEAGRTVSRYHDALDRLRVDLGLPPDAPVIPEDDLLAGFRDVFEAVGRAESATDTEPSQLTAICDRLPELDDTKIGGRSLLDVSAGVGPISGLMSEVRKGLAGRAKLSGRDGDRRLRQAREAVRALAVSPREYLSHRKAFAQAIRQRRFLLAKIIAPPDAAMTGPESSLAIDFLDFVSSGSTAQKELDRVARSWTDYQIHRIAVYHALGELPFEDWPGFIRSFRASAAPPKDVERPSGPRNAPSPPEPPPLPLPPVEPELSEGTPPSGR